MKGSALKLSDMKLPWSSKCSVRERINAYQKGLKETQYQVVRHSHSMKSVMFVTAKEIEENLGQTLKSSSLIKIS